MGNRGRAWDSPRVACAAAWKVCCVALFLGLMMAVATADALTYTVTTLSDAVANDSQCSLREAIQEANNGADTDCAGSPSNGNDTIVFSVSGTIALSSTLPNILDAATVGALTIDGGGYITISGDSNGDRVGDVRVMVVDSGANLTLQNLTIASGSAPSSLGGGIWNSGALHVSQCTFSNNSAGWGGAIYNASTLSLSSSTFSGNNTTDYGGAIRNDGTLTVGGSTFSSNTAATSGGAIYNIFLAALIVTNTSFNSNSANFGGAIANDNIMTVTGSVFSTNSATDSGGAIRNDGTLTVMASSFSGNTATSGSGGGIYNFYGTLTVDNSDFSGNRARYGGGIWNKASLYVTTTTVRSNFASNEGGGMSNVGVADVKGSTFTGNEAGDLGGGILNNSGGTLAVTNSTLSENRVDPTTGRGGAICNDGGTLTLINSTLSANEAFNGGGLYTVPSSSATLKNTIIANSTLGGDCTGTLSGSNINNLIEGTGIAACGLTNGSNGNIVGLDPNLGALTGSPAYFPLNLGSPAIDAGDNTTCATAPVNNQSQNGVTRPQDGNGDTVPICDIGSFEAPAAPAAQSDMAASLGSLPPSLSPGGSYSPLTFSCTNNGPGAAINPTCSITASAGTVSILSCSPALPVGSLASGASISCTFDFTAPGTAGGFNTPETGVTFTVTTGAANDSNTANNTASNISPIPIVDALDDAATFPAGSTQSYNVGANDQYGGGSLPTGSPSPVFALDSGNTTCSGAGITSPGGAASFQVPSSGSCVVAYRVCVISGCDTAQLVVTAQQQPQPIPALDEWGLTALVLLMVGAGLLLVRRLVA